MILKVADALKSLSRTPAWPAGRYPDNVVRRDLNKTEVALNPTT